MLWHWEEYGDGSLEDLANRMAEAFGDVSGDPVAALEARKQGKVERVRAFGLALKRLACEAYPGVEQTTEWLLTKVNGLFIRGLYDPELVQDLSREWRTWMSLGELINISEDMVRKRRLLPGMASSHASVG